VPSNPAPLGEAIAYFDHFRVSNRYEVPEIGVSAELRYGRCFLQAAGKLGLGWLHQDTKTEGSTTQQLADGTVNLIPRGVLAPVSDAGDRDRLAFLSELSVRAGFEVTSWCRLHVEYDLLFASQVLRAGQLIGGVASAQVPQLPSYDPNVASPGRGAAVRGESFWVQGLAAGLEFRY